MAERDVSVISSILRIDVPDLGELKADLEAVELGLGGELDKVIKEAAAPVLTEAKALSPYDPEHRGHPRNDLPHIRESLTLRAAQGGVVLSSDHPGAVVWEFGGVIAPKGFEIRIPERAMARQAGEDKAGELEQRAQQGIERLLSSRNL